MLLFWMRSFPLVSQQFLLACPYRHCHTSWLSRILIYVCVFHFRNRNGRYKDTTEPTKTTDRRPKKGVWKTENGVRKEREGESHKKIKRESQKDKRGTWSTKNRQWKLKGYR